MLQKVKDQYANTIIVSGRGREDNQGDDTD